MTATIVAPTGPQALDTRWRFAVVTITISGGAAQWRLQDDAGGANTTIWQGDISPNAPVHLIFGEVLLEGSPGKAIAAQVDAAGSTFRSSVNLLAHHF